MNDANDDTIRDAIHHLANAAPPPRPLPSSAPAPLPGPRSYRWVAIVGSLVVIAAGAIAIAAWPGNDDEAPSVSESTTVTSDPPQTVAETTLPAPTTTVPATVAATPPATAHTATTAPPPPDRTDPPISEFEITMPSGELIAGPDDLIVTHLDGDLWLYPGALGAAPGAPALLVDMPDPNVATDEGPPPNEVSGVAGVINGALLYGECCEPVAGNLMALTSLGAPPEPVAFGATPVLSPDGTRVATINSFSIDVWNLVEGVRISQEIPPDSPFANAQDLVWSADSSELFVLTYVADGWGLIRTSATPPFKSLSSRLHRHGNQSLELGSLIGLDPGGNLVVRWQTDSDPTFQALETVSLQPIEGEPSQYPLGDNSSRYRRSADGQRMIRWNDSGLWLVNADTGGSEQQVVFEGVRDAWFVGLGAP